MFDCQKHIDFSLKMSDRKCFFLLTYSGSNLVIRRILLSQQIHKYLANLALVLIKVSNDMCWATICIEMDSQTCTTFFRICHTIFVLEGLSLKHCMENHEIALVVFTLNNTHSFLVFYRKRIKLHQYGVAASATTTDAATTDATATTASSSSAECGPYGNYIFSSFSLNSVVIITMDVFSFKNVC